MGKMNLSKKQCYGLTADQVKMVKSYLKRNKYSEAIIPASDQFKIFQMFVLGSSFAELAAEFPPYTTEQVIITAAKYEWIRKREASIATLQEQIKVKILKSVLGSIDFVTMLLNVTNQKHVESMRKQLASGNFDKLEMKIGTLKEYKEMLEILQKLATSMQVSPVDAMNNQEKPKQLEDDSEEVPSLLELTQEQEAKKEKALYGKDKKFEMELAEAKGHERDDDEAMSG